MTACIRARAGLDTLSRERVRMETLKLVVAARATPTLAVMAESGLLGMVLGGVAYLASFENTIKADAALGVEAPRLGLLFDGTRHSVSAGRLGRGGRGAAHATAAFVQRRIRTAVGARWLVARGAAA